MARAVDQRRPPTGERRWASAACACAVVAAAALAPATNQPAAAAPALFHELMSPYCPGRLLADCPSPDAIALRHSITTRLAAGEDEAAIRVELEHRFGDAVMAAPRTDGWGLVGWLMPPLAMCLGAVATVGWLLRHAGAAAAPPRSQVPDPAHLAILERELRDPS